MNKNLRQEIDELLGSGSFDEAWYLRTYPDVKMTGLEPAEHYIRVGSLLGRRANGTQSSSIARRATQQEHAGLTGRIEATANRTITGWAMRKEAEGRPVHVRATINGVFYGEFPANLPRSDLRKLSRHFDGGGFAIPVPFAKPPQDLSIQLDLGDPPLPLKGSPVTVAARHPPGLERLTMSLLERVANPRVAIVVPIYNAPQEVDACLKALLEYTSFLADLILIDDCSTDPAVATVLGRYEAKANVRHFRNERNRGFTTTVNRGIELAGRADVVLLNSDTIVAPRWLENLRNAAYSDLRIGTATPFSDNAGAFSAPTLGVRNERPRWLTPAGHARVALQSGLNLRPVVPTGNGFCMYVRRDCLDDMGVLDQEAFPRGYGEENDFCLRAARSGWLNVVDDRTLILHTRSASFGQEKVRLAEAGRRVVDERYPEYRKLTGSFHSDRKLLSARFALRQALERPDAGSQAGRPRYLFVVSTRTGGTPQTNEDLMRSVSDEIEPWLLRCDSREMTLSRLVGRSFETVEHQVLADPVQVISHRSAEYDDVLARWLELHAIELVHVRHISWHSLGLFDISRILSIPVVFSFHDFYSLCPTVNLLDAELKYCGGNCTASQTPCSAELWPAGSVPQLKHHWIHQWQRMMRESLTKCSALVTTSEHVRRTILVRYPELGSLPFEIIPHGRHFEVMRDLTVDPGNDRKIRLLIPGNLNPKKGSEFIMRLHDADAGRRLEFHLLGSAPDDLKGKHIIRHGSYKRDEFAKHVAEISPHFGCVFSICPESHCHTLTELWSVGAPVLGFDVGAVGERLRDTGAGWFLDPEDPAGAVAEIYRISRSQEDYETVKAATLSWQRHLGASQTVDFMASSYKALYEALTRNRLASNVTVKTAKPRVGLVTRGDHNTSIAPGSVHVRVWERCRNGPGRRAEYIRVSEHELLQPGRLQTFSALIVQRDCIDADLIDDIVTEAKAQRVPIIFEIDDDLLNLDDHHVDSSLYRETAESLQKLARSAHSVTVSTSHLRKRMLEHNSNVQVIENGLSARLWFAPLDEEPAPLTPFSPGIRVLYMGSDTHKEDLALLRKPLELAKADGHHIELFVIGGQPDRESWYTKVQIPGDARNYPSFVPWFRRVSASMDVGVAPLVDTTFNRSKSGLKLLEYAGAGLTGLFSDVEPYRELVREGGHGKLVENNERAWRNALVSLTQSPDQLKLQGEAACTWVSQKHCIEDSFSVYDDFVLSVVGTR